MTTCESVQQHIAAAPLEDLPDKDREAVLDHLEQCPHCATHQAAYDAVAPMVRAALAVEVSDTLQAELDAAVMAALAEVG